MMSTIIIFWFLLLSIIMAISTSSLFSLWVCLEINMMMFIPLMNSKNILSSNSMLLYFIVQSLASSIFILSFFLTSLNPTIMNPLSSIITSAILMKLGASPFHMWFPQVSEGLTFMSLCFLILIQKIIPLYILSFMNNNLLYLSVMCSSMIGSLGGWNQNSIRKIITFSSIAHLAWMISMISCSNNWWILYFIIYSFIIYSLITSLFFMNISYLSQLNHTSKNSHKLMFIIVLMSLGGMPPFMGFFMKWMSIKIIISSSVPFLMTFLITSSLLNLYFYSRILFPIFLKLFHINNLSKPKTKKTFITSLIHSFSLFILIPLI
nr:NADH dehydrogenase subunit 2 [Secretargas transgariepinus]QLD97089.1 NADH dehydrogenase subunit 2 [Secretargas transgariepinus]